MPRFDYFLKRFAAPEPTTRLEAALNREMLISERLRVRLLAVIFGLLWLVYASVLVFAPALPLTLFAIAWWVPGLILGAIFVYELLAQAAISQFIRLNLSSPTLPRYLNALIEISFPTFGVWLVAVIILTPEAALNSPPSQLYYFFILLSVLRLDVRLCLFTTAVAVIEYLAVALLLGVQWDQSVDGLPLLAVVGYRTTFLLMAGLGTVFVAQQFKHLLTRTLSAVQEYDRVVDMFGQHVSPTVAEKLLSQKLEGESETRQVCLMFVDIRNFTAFAENVAPAEVVAYLNVLFEPLVECVNRQNGVVNKFLGDGFMAVFGAPLDDDRHIQNAVAAAQEMLAQVSELNRKEQFPTTRLGIGLHAGQAVTGNVGSAQRKEYTIIGDVVNLAARIEQLNKQFDSQLLISETVRLALAETEINAEALGTINVKGHSAPVSVYKLA